MTQTFEAALLSGQDGEAAASFAGPISDAAAVTVAAVLKQALAAEPRRLVIDLRRVSAVDEPAIAVLNAAARRADARDIGIVIREPRNGVGLPLGALERGLVTIQGT
jgi:anti-anti-sigma regulatory factor